MKAVYPVLFTKTDDGKYLIDAPDLNVLTEGKDMSDAIKMARDAMELTCVSMEDREVEIPKPTNITDIDIAKSAFFDEGETIISLVDIDSTEYRRKIDTKSVRRNVALPSWLNYEAEHSGINVSKVLQDALIQVLNVTDRPNYNK